MNPAHRSRLAFTVAVICLVSLVAIPAAIAKVTLSEMISHDKLRNATFGDDLVHEFSEKPRKVRVTVDCKLKRGEFAWRVEDPEGNVLWRESVRGKATVDLVEEFPGEAGEWRIVLDYKKATGRYHIKMEAVIP